MIKDISKVLLMTDLDGTLLPSDKVLSKNDVQAIRKFENAGGKFTIATGRTIQSVECYLDELQLKMPFVIYNGAAIYDLQKKSAVYAKELPKSARQIVNDVLTAMPNIAGEILTMDNIYVPQNNEYESHHIAVCQVIPQYKELSDIPDGGWLKALFALNPNDVQLLIDYIDSKDYGREVDFVRSAGIFYEMLPKNVSKGSALLEYRKLLGLSDYTIIAVGDYHNDIEMLKAADIGVATANAQQIVKDNADIVLTHTCDENAISELIDMILNYKL